MLSLEHVVNAPAGRGVCVTVLLPDPVPRQEHGVRMLMGGILLSGRYGEKWMGLEGEACVLQTMLIPRAPRIFYCDLSVFDKANTK